jgi:hypothetical protein
MKVDGVSFADGFIEKFKTEAAFLKEMAKDGYGHIFHGPKRIEQLKEVYKIHHSKK